MYYSRVAIILFGRGLFKSVFSTYFFGKLGFCSSVFWFFMFLYLWFLAFIFMFYVLNSMSFLIMSDVISFFNFLLNSSQVRSVSAKKISKKPSKILLMLPF